jgi:hypothetical protein
MSLTHDELDYYLTKIFSGVDFVYVGNLLLMFKYPNNVTKQRANLIYEKSYDDAVNNGILPQKDLEELIDKRNIITTAEKKFLKKLKDQLEAQMILLSKTTRVKANQDRIKGIIIKIRRDIFEIESKKNSKLMMSAENKAEEEKTVFMASRCTYKEDESLFWATYDEIKNDIKIDLRDKILLKFLRFYSGLSSSIIREVARSNLWRIRYINSVKTSDQLFGIPTSEYSANQLSLAYWSNYYQNIFEMSAEDRPSELIIDDDESLDAYMKSVYEERNRDDASRRSKAKRSGKLSAFNSEEVIVTRSHELYEEIKYDTPKEAQKLKDRVDLKKKTNRRG